MMSNMTAIKTWTFVALFACVVYGQRRPPNYQKNEMPDTGFSCKDKVVGGYYADPETSCQMFHVCVNVVGTGVQDFRFLCPNDTAFDQENQICDDWYNIDCEAATLYYSDNFDLYRLGSGGAPATSGRVTPIPLGPSSVAPNVQPPKPRKPSLSTPVNNAVSENDDDYYLQRSDATDSRLQHDLLRGSSSGNFYSNRNRGVENPDDYDDARVPVASSKDVPKKNAKAPFRKLLTGKKPLAESSTTTTTVTAAAPASVPTSTETVQRSSTTIRQPNYKPTTYRSKDRGRVNYKTYLDKQTKADEYDFQKVAKPAATVQSTTFAPASSSSYQPTTAKVNNVYQTTTQVNNVPAFVQVDTNQPRNNDFLRIAPTNANNGFQSKRINAVPTTNNNNNHNFQVTNQFPVRNNNFQANNPLPANNNNNQANNAFSANNNNNFQANNAFSANSYDNFQANNAIPVNNNNNFQANNAIPVNSNNNFQANNAIPVNSNNNFQANNVFSANSNNNFQANNGFSANKINNYQANNAFQPLNNNLQPNANFNQDGGNFQSDKVFTTTQNYNNQNPTTRVYQTNTFQQQQQQQQQQFGNTFQPSNQFQGTVQTTQNYNANAYQSSPTAYQQSTNVVQSSTPYRAGNEFVQQQQQTSQQPQFQSTTERFTKDSKAKFDPYNSYHQRTNEEAGELLKTAPSSNLRPSDLNALSQPRPKFINATLSVGYNFNKADGGVAKSTVVVQAPTTQKPRPFSVQPVTVTVPAVSSSSSRPASSTTVAATAAAASVTASSSTKKAATKDKDSSYDYAYYDDSNHNDYTDVVPEDFSRIQNAKNF